MNEYRLRAVALAICFLLSPQLALAQDSNPEPAYEHLTQFLKRDYFSLGALLQVVADVQPERQQSGSNGFSVANFRLNIKGALDGGFGYKLQADFLLSPSLLDANMYYQPDPAVRITAGKLKAPFSGEYLTSADGIDFVNRAQVVTSIQPRRQIGVQLSGQSNSGTFGYAAGIFNGNASSANGNDNNDFLYVARTTVSTPLGGENASGLLQIGANVAGSHDTRYAIPGDRMPLFSGDRLLYGGDVRLTIRKWLLAAEAVGANLEPFMGATMKPFGYHITAGYMVSSKSQLLARWDSFDAQDFNTVGGKTDWVILGFNHWPTKATELQINYIIDVDDRVLKHNQWLMNLQIVI